MISSELADIVEAVASSSNYKHICRETIELAAIAEATKYKSYKLTIKAVKNRLHQISSTFVQYKDLKCAASHMEQLAGYFCANDINGIFDECDNIMRLHKSSNERVNFIEEFYGRIFDVTGIPETILDIACGLNPFSIPRMGINNISRYTAIDISLLTIELIKSFFNIAGVPGEAFGKDVMHNIPTYNVDIAYVFKLLPLLEQQKKGYSAQFIPSLCAKYVVVSFPIKSISGKEKGMLKNYTSFYEPIFEQYSKILSSYVIHNELVYILSKAP